MLKAGVALPLLLLLLAATPAHPQDSKLPTTDRVIDRMAAKLSLTADQTEKIRPILIERQQKLRDLRAESGRARQKLRKAKDILDASDKQINPILTPDQRKSYQQMEEEMMANLKAKRRSTAGNDLL